ncbi:MAG TPA: SDR family oxidoreductase [Dehalococcoidia bacterium]
MATGLDLTGRVALVVGAGNAVGRAVAVALAEAGADVAAATVTPTTEQEFAANSVANEVWAVGRRNLALPLDVTDPESVRAGVERVAAELGRLDILVNNVDLPYYQPFTEIPREALSRVLAVNLEGVFLVTQEAGRRMLEAGWGRVINLVPLAGERGVVHGTAYGAAKAGVLNLTRSLALEWARRGVTVNAVGLGWTTGLPGPTDHPDRRAELERYLPARRLAEPGDFAGAVVYLASEAAAFMTGQVLNVEGGALSHV